MIRACRCRFVARYIAMLAAAAMSFSPAIACDCAVGAESTCCSNSTMESSCCCGDSRSPNRSPEGDDSANTCYDSTDNSSRCVDDCCTGEACGCATPDHSTEAATLSSSLLISDDFANLTPRLIGDEVESPLVSLAAWRRMRGPSISRKPHLLFCVWIA